MPLGNPETPGVRWARLWPVGAALGIVLVTVLAYVPAMRAGFIWDDGPFLTENPLMKSVDGLRRFWFSTDPPDYWPLTSTTLWVEWRLWGMDASGYHVTNVLLHALSGVLVWRVLRRLEVPGAWVAGAVFAVHPVNVESVAWITERKNALTMPLYLLSLLVYLRFDEDGKRRWYWLSLLLFVMGMLSKAAATMLPVVLLGCVWWRRGKITRRDVLRSVPFFVAGAVLAMVTVWFQYHRSIQATVIRTDSFASRLAGAGWAVWFYLYKAVLPIDLCFVYPRWSIPETSGWSYVPGALLVVWFAALWRYRRRWGRPVLFALGYFVVGLFPVMGFWNVFFMRYSLVADHWQYMSIVGVIALAAGAGWRFGGRLRGPWRAAGIGVASAVVVVLSVLTWRQCGIYKDEETIWRDTIAKNDGAWMAYHNLGVLQFKQGKTAEALANVLACLDRNPAVPEAHNDAGVMLLCQGQYRQALGHFQEAVRLDPNTADGYNGLGAALAGLGEGSKAVECFRQAVTIRPDCPDALVNLAGALLREGRTEEAIPVYRRAIEVDPGRVNLRVDLGKALVLKEDFKGATTQFSEATRLDPGNGRLRYQLGVVLAMQSRNAEAIEQYRHAVRLDPNLSDAMMDLAWLLSTGDDPDLRNGTEAVDLARQACFLTQIGSPKAFDALAAAYAEVGQFDKAVAMAKKGISLAYELGDRRLVASMVSRLRLYEARTPCRQGRGSGP